MAPKGTPAGIISKLRNAIAEAVKDPNVQFLLGDPVGATTAASTPEEFAERIRKESDRWREVIRANNIKVD